jgi:hypothetical protein
VATLQPSTGCSANPETTRRRSLVYGGSPATLGAFGPGRRRRHPSRFADYVVGEDGKVVLEGYFKDGYTIPVLGMRP